MKLLTNLGFKKIINSFDHFLHFLWIYWNDLKFYFWTILGENMMRWIPKSWKRKIKILQFFQLLLKWSLFVFHAPAFEYYGPQIFHLFNKNSRYLYFCYNIAFSSNGILYHIDKSNQSYSCNICNSKCSKLSFLNILNCFLDKLLYFFLKKRLLTMIYQSKYYLKNLNFHQYIKFMA